MSIASEITRIQTNVANAYDALEAKGATMPANENTDSLVATINTISAGGGDVVTILNHTGLNISTGDKVWIDQARTTQGYFVCEYNSSSNTRPSKILSSNGLCYASGMGTNNGNVYKVANDFSSETLLYNSTYISSYGSIGYTFLGRNLFQAGAGYNNPYDYLIGTEEGNLITSPKVGSGNYQSTISCPQTRENYYRMNYNTLYLWNKETESATQITPDISGATDCNGFSWGDIVYLQKNGAVKKIVIDTTNHTQTTTDIGTASDVSTQMMMCVTSDGNYILFYGNVSQYSAGKTLSIYKLNENSIEAYTQDLPESLTSWLSTVGSFIYNPNSNILFCNNFEPVTSQNFKMQMFHYDGSGAWSEMPVDFSQLIAKIKEKSQGYWSTDGAYCIRPFIDNYGSIGAINYSYEGGGSGKPGYQNCLLFNIASTTSGYVAVPYTTGAMMQSTLTGFAEENIAIGSSGSATTVLPPSS